MEERVRRLGSEKEKSLKEDFDTIYDKYKKQALDEGYEGQIKMTKEKGKIIFFVVI
jgi:predicted HAD superfamily hydrolase